MEILQKIVCALLMANLEVPDGHPKMHEGTMDKEIIAEGKLAIQIDTRPMLVTVHDLTCSSL